MPLRMTRRSRHQNATAHLNDCKWRCRNIADPSWVGCSVRPRPRKKVMYLVRPGWPGYVFYGATMNHLGDDARNVNRSRRSAIDNADCKLSGMIDVSATWRSSIWLLINVMTLPVEST